MASEFASMARAHTAAAAVLVAGVVLVPLGLWLYAKVASVDKGEQVAHALGLLADAPPPAGSRRLALHVYPVRRWEGESLVPIASYWVETAYRLRTPLEPARLVEHYRRQLPGWRYEDKGPARARFTRGDAAIELDIAEYAAGEKALRSYGVFVSQ